MFYVTLFLHGTFADDSENVKFGLVKSLPIINVKSIPGNVV